jgi:tetratricopeptide (TPR) repeat protein
VRACVLKQGAVGKQNRLLLLVVAAAALFRVAFFLQYRARSVFFDVPSLDALLYDQWARQIAAGTYRATRPFYLAPGYPYAVAALYRYVSSSLTALYVSQLLLGLVTIVLVHRLATAAYGRRAGLIAAVLVVLYAPLPFLEMKVLSATLAVTLLLGALAALCDAQSRGGWWRWCLGGVLLGATSLVRPETLILAPLLIVWLVRWRPPLAAATLVLASWAIAIAPVAIHNLRAGGGLGTLISSQGALAFYQANNPRARGFFVLLREDGFSGAPDRQEGEEQALAERAAGRRLTRAEASRYWLGRGLEFVTTQPGQFARLLGQKLLKFAGSTEYATEFNLRVERETLWLLWLPCLPFALLFALAVPSLVAQPPDATASLLRAAFVATLATVLVFYMSSRYRLAAVPPLAAFAACTLERLATRGRRALVTASVVLAIFAVAHPEWDTTGVHQDAAAHCNMGLAWIGRKGDPARAVPEFRRSVEIDPSRAECWYDLGVALLALRRPADAAGAFGEATTRTPTYVEAHIGRGRALEEAGDAAGARAAYAAALRLRPGDPELARAVERLDAGRGG